MEKIPDIKKSLPSIGSYPSAGRGAEGNGRWKRQRNQDTIKISYIYIKFTKNELSHTKS